MLLPALSFLKKYCNLKPFPILTLKMNRIMHESSNMTVAMKRKVFIDPRAFSAAQRDMLLSYHV
jgi:hypothetical protein